MTIDTLYKEIINGRTLGVLRRFEIRKCRKCSGHLRLFNNWVLASRVDRASLLIYRRILLCVLFDDVAADLGLARANILPLIEYLVLLVHRPARRHHRLI